MQSKDPGSNPGAVKSLFFHRKISNSLNLYKITSFKKILFLRFVGRNNYHLEIFKFGLYISLLYIDFVNEVNVKIPNFVEIEYSLKLQIYFRTYQR